MVLKSTGGKEKKFHPLTPFHIFLPIVTPPPTLQHSSPYFPYPSSHFVRTVVGSVKHLLTSALGWMT
jgi:hypothetical protein